MLLREERCVRREMMSWLLKQNGIDVETAETAVLRTKRYLSRCGGGSMLPAPLLCFAGLVGWLRCFR